MSSNCVNYSVALSLNIQDLVLTSCYIDTGCMYSMAAFGPVLGFLLGAYLLSFHMDALATAAITIGK